MSLMLVQAHQVILGEQPREEFTLPLQPNSQILHIHHFNLPHNKIEIVEMHEDGNAAPIPRRFYALDTFCLETAKLPLGEYRFTGAVSFDNHLWNIFENMGA